MGDISNSRPPYEVLSAIPGKTIPFEYPLILHLLDSMAVADALWGSFVSVKQKLFLSECLGVGVDDVRRLVLAAVGLHDIGKANPYWLNKTLKLTAESSVFDERHPFGECSSGDPRRRHDFMGAVFVERDGAWVCDNTRKFLSEVVKSHHGDFGSDDVFGSDYSLPGDWGAVQADIEAQVLSVAGLDLGFELPSDVVVDFPGVVVLVSGIVVLSDWIASSRRHMVAVRGLSSGGDYEEHYSVSFQVACEFVQSEGFVAPDWVPGLSWGELFPQIETPNELQSSLVERADLFEKPGLVLMSAPMGMGKTEASLYIASQFGVKCGLSGVWLALPTRATTNVMFERMLGLSERVFENPRSTVSLMHSSSFIAEAITGFPRSTAVRSSSNSTTESQIYDEDEPSENLGEFISSFMEESRQGGLSTIAVSTIDQLLQVSIPLKHNMLRWLGVSGKVVILDEVHDFDRYTFGLILKFVSWAASLSIPVVVMSATLSRASQFELLNAYNPEMFSDKESYESVTSPGWVYAPAGAGEPARVSMDEESSSLSYMTSLVKSDQLTDSVLKIVKEELPNSPSVLVVGNTVNQAVHIFRTLNESNLGVPVFLLHSRMTEQQKHEIIEKVLSLTGKNATTREPHILVSTQLVQQSIDIDYDVLITPISPLPEIMQRIGRVHRHVRSDRSAVYEGRPKVFVLYPEVFDDLGSVSVAGRAFGKFYLPYSAADVVASLETLKGLGLSDGSVFDWKAKMNIGGLLNLKDSVYERLKSEDYFVELSAFDEHLDFLKENMQESVSVKSPSGYHEDMWSYELTAPYTSKSAKAAKTRLISETVTVAFIEKRGSKLFLAAPSDGEMLWLELSPENFIRTMKDLSRNSFNIPAYKYKELCKSYEIGRDFEKYEKSLKIAIYDADMLLQSEGLVQSFISDETTWI